MANDHEDLYEISMTSSATKHLAAFKKSPVDDSLLYHQVKNS